MSSGGFLKGDRTLYPARLLRRISMQGVTILTVLVMLGSIMSVPNASAQDTDESTQTPDAALPGGDDEADAEGAATPSADDDEGDNAASDEVTPTTDEDAGDSALEPGHAVVVSQGLAFLTGDQAVWQVREIELSGGQAEMGGAAHVLQRDGETIIRNDVTAKRTLLEPGEGFFRAGDDAYTFTSEGGDSTVWMFEVVDQDNVADDAFYESPLIDQYEEGTYDAELIRFELEPGDEFDLPAHTGPALMMVTSGEVDVENEQGLGLLEDGFGQLIADEATVRNSGSEPASFVLAAFGASVGDDSGTTAGEVDATAVAGDDEEAPDAAADDASGTAADADAESDTLAEEETADTTEDDTTSDEPAATGDSEFSATINVTAQIDLTLTIVADGVTVFDGPLPAGSSSGPVAGSTFEVATSSGANTVFTDACGTEFLMGYEEGPVTYTLTADASSCAP